MRSKPMLVLGLMSGTSADGIDVALARIADPPALALRLAGIPGVVEHGLFIGLVGAAIVAGAGGVRMIEALR